MGSSLSHPRAVCLSSSLSFRRRTSTISALATSTGHSAGTASVAPSATASSKRTVYGVAWPGCTHAIATDASAMNVVIAVRLLWPSGPHDTTISRDGSDGFVVAAPEGPRRPGGHPRDVGHLPGVHARLGDRGG